MKRLIIVMFAAVAISCTNPERAKKALEDSGYTDITLTGYRYTGCSEDDYFHTGFIAKGPTGRPVSGVVCDGGPWGKGKTIRLD